MFRVIKRIWLMAVLLLLGIESSRAFSLLGPFEPYQTPIIAYRLGGDIGGPLSIGEQYRWNTRNLYYAVDANFFNFFGSNGLAAVDQAFAVLNNLSNVSSYSSDLSEWPITVKRINHRAESIGLSDLKSQMITLLAEQLGLADPDRYTWTLRTRAPGNACPVTAVYDVIQRNYDPVTFEPTSYVNGTLYTYTIIEICTGPNPLADAVEFPVDPAAEVDSSVVSALTAGSPFAGQYITGLSRDDIGALRFLWASNRVYLEPMEANTPSFLVDTNNSLSLLVTSNLATLAGAQVTNTGAQLAALFPGIQILHTNALGFSNVVTTNVTAFLTNNPFGPPGSTITAFATTFVTNILPVFQYTFGNVVTNVASSNHTVVIQTTNITGNPTGPPGSLLTNVTSTTTTVPGVSGEFLIIPANQCGFSVISTQLTTIVATTNPVVGTTNQANVTFFTNHTLVVSIPNCLTNNISLRQGMEKIHFFRKDFDSLLGQDWTPVTNIFTLIAVTNSQMTTQTVFRLVTQPDILISAQDTVGAGVIGVRSISFNSNAIGGGLAGPGIIQPPVAFILDKVGPLFQNPGPNGAFLPPFNEGTQGVLFRWGSFNGTTNEPIAYPDGTSILNLENNIFLQITVAGPLPIGHVGQAYSFQVPVTGAQPQPPFYSWSLISQLQGVPPPTQPAPGLNLTSTNTLGVVISGTPTTTGIFDFSLQVSDSAGRVNLGTLSIEIDP